MCLSHDSLAQSVDTEMFWADRLATISKHLRNQRLSNLESLLSDIMLITTLCCSYIFVVQALDTLYNNFVNVTLILWFAGIYLGQS